MLTIKKLRADHVIDFAAEELKKYLRMMMPRCGEIAISYDPDATDGFRLGLMEDFRLPCEAEDVVLDDVVHIETDTQGGILAGSNSRSVLYAVYRFLRLNGCRWLYAGIDGEHIPVADITPQSYHKMADHRFRGHCNEGSESQTCMLETIDFYAKQELNVYMIEFDIPYAYYAWYYDHSFNTNNRPADPVTYQQVLQWKRQCEAELSKRGLQFHDMGHGWTAEPFGFDSTEGWTRQKNIQLTDAQKEAIALRDGERTLWNDVPLNTNLCMSNPKVRATVVNYIADYAQAATNVDYLHVWLADGSRNHCECDECQKMRPSDYYLVMMNELDEELTARNLDTRIVFISYVDTLFAPEKITIKNPKRFSMLFAPIARSYCSSVDENAPIPAPEEYVRNKWKSPKDAMGHLALLRQWQENWKGASFSYEYHFWKHQCYDPSGLHIARRVYEDIKTLKYMGLDGYVEDGSQRSFFPNGFALYVYAETLLNVNADFDALMEDYFSHAYGADWKKALAYFKDVSKCFEFPYMEGEDSADLSVSDHYNPAQTPKLERAQEIAAQGRKLVKAQKKPFATRSQSVSWRLLQLHAEYIHGYSEIMCLLSKGYKTLAFEKAQEFFDSFGVHEFEIERYLDFAMAFRFIHRAVTIRPTVVLQEGY